MFIEQISGQNIKIKFDVNEKQLLLGDVLKITAAGKNGVLAQVIDISTVEKNPNFNMAESKILYTIDSTGKLVNWQGNIPSQDFYISKISSQELMLCSNTLSPLNPLPIGNLSLYPEIQANIESSFLESPTVIYCDKQSQKTNIINLLASELSNNGEKTVILDMSGNFGDLQNAISLTAGKDFKLPFDTKGLELLYNKSLLGLAPETRASIEDIFMEIEEYLAGGKVDFLPFANFRQAVDTVHKSNKTAELVLLKNKLAKLDKQGVFADKRNEVTSFTGNINLNNLVIVSLSEFPAEWQKELVEFIIDSNIQKFRQKFFMLVDLDKLNADKAFIEKLCIKANKSGISPIILTGHESETAVSILSFANNIIAFAPENTTKLEALKAHLTRLRNNEAVITGKITNNVPLYVDIVDTEANAATYYPNKVVASATILPEIYLSTEIEEQEFSQIPQEEDSFNYADQFAHDETKIELASDISNLQEAPELNGFAEEDEEYEEELIDTDFTDEELVNFSEQTDIQEEETTSGISSFYDEFQSEEANHDNELSEDDLSAYLEENAEYDTTSLPQEDDARIEGDEDFDYDSIQQDQDESALDYADYDEMPIPSRQPVSYSEDYSSDELTLSGVFDEVDEYAQEEAGFSGDIKEFSSQEIAETQKLTEADIIPILPASSGNKRLADDEVIDYQEGDKVHHDKYGIGTVVKIIGKEEKKLCSIQFDDVGRRLLDPRLAGLQKI
jgi:hypothetical protein